MSHQFTDPTPARHGDERTPELLRLAGTIWQLDAAARAITNATQLGRIPATDGRQLERMTADLAAIRERVVDLWNAEVTAR